MALELGAFTPAVAVPRRNKPVDTGLFTSEDPMTDNSLLSTAWLAKRLGLSVSTIERLRAQNAGELPPHLVVGRRTIRYDEAVVADWLSARQAKPLEREPVEVAVPEAAATPKKKVFGTRLIVSSGTDAAGPRAELRAQSTQGGHYVAS